MRDDLVQQVKEAKEAYDTAYKARGDAAGAVNNASVALSAAEGLLRVRYRALEDAKDRLVAAMLVKDA